MPTTINFVRHGEVANPEKIAYGRMPGFHLSEKGQRTAKKVGELFSRKKISTIYTSPLERTFQTANFISDSFSNPLKVVHKYELIELDQSKWQSLPLDELFQNKYYEEFFLNPKSEDIPENLNALARRMEKFTLDLCTKHRGEEIICVSHEYPIIVLKLKLESEPLTNSKNLLISTGSINTMVFDDSCDLIETS